MDNYECEMAVLRADFQVPLTFPEFCGNMNLPTASHAEEARAMIAYGEYYENFQSNSDDLVAMTPLKP